MIIISYSFYILAGILIFFLVFPFITVLVSLFIKERFTPRKPEIEYDFANIITAYRNAEIAKPLIQSLLRQTHVKHHIYLVADACQKMDFGVEDPRLTVLFPNPALNLKAKSIIHAVERFQREHDYIAIFDADNLAHPAFLQTLNAYSNAGHKAIQGQRTAKNLDSIYACADSLGEFYKNYIERYVPYLLNSSTVISGSGMAVEANLYKSYLYGPEIQKGKELWKKMLQEDKILQNHLLYKDEQIVYAKDAIVYDEKVSAGDAVETQRSRWLFSYFQNLPNSSGLLLKGLFTFNWNQLFFGVVTLSPPLFILIFFSGCTALLGFLINWKVSLLIITAMFIFTGNIFLCLYLSKVPKQIWQAIWALPLFIGKQVTALFKMANPNKNFKHSEHSKTVSIDDLLKK